MDKREHEEYWYFMNEKLSIPKDVDLIGRYILVLKAVEALRAEPDIDMTTLSWKTGLNKTDQAGMIGWHMQVAKDIIRRMEECKVEPALCTLCPDYGTRYPISNDFFGEACQINGVRCCEVCYNVHLATKRELAIRAARDYEE